MRIAICLFVAICALLVGCKKGNPLASFMSRAPSCAVADELLYQIDNINEDVGMSQAFQAGLQALPEDAQAGVISRINAKVASDGARMRAQGNVREWIALLLLSTKSEARAVDNYRYCNGDFDLGNGQNLHWVYSVTKGENGPELRINKAEVTAGAPVAAASPPSPPPAEVPVAGADSCSAIAQVAVDFMNLYIRHMNDQYAAADAPETYDWLKSNSLADPSLASAYAEFAQADFDPILNAQDSPSKFKFLRCTEVPGVVQVQGEDMALTVSVKVASTAQGLRVVGVGCVNMPCGEDESSAATGHDVNVATSSASPPAAAPVASPSFQCPGSPGADPARRYSTTELAICGNAALAALDVRMAEAYRAAKSRSADGPGLKRDQLRWLAGLNACGSDAACLSREYEVRIAELVGS